MRTMQEEDQLQNPKNEREREEETVKEKRLGAKNDAPIFLIYAKHMESLPPD